MLHCTEYYARFDWSLRFMCKIIDSSLEENVDLHKFALGKCVAKLWKLRSKCGAKMVNATFAWALFSNPVCFGIQRWYLPSLPHDLLLSFYFLCDIFAMTKFVPIVLWSSVLVCKHLTSRQYNFWRISMNRSSNSKQRETLLLFSTNRNALSSTVYGLRRGAIGQFRIIYY